MPFPSSRLRQSIYRSQEVGGLGVRRIRDFNIALLGKWCWRLLVERDRLWFRVLSSRYGVEDGRVREGGREASAWWREISVLRSGEWFQGNVDQVVGDGKNTLFWSDTWVGGECFKDRFTRLYELLELKGESVFNMHVLGWGGWGGLEVDRSDRWTWRLESSSLYTVRSTYKFFNANVHVDSEVPASSMWLKDVPLKVDGFFRGIAVGCSKSLLSVQSYWWGGFVSSVYHTGGGQNQVTNLQVVEGETRQSSPQLSWLVAKSVFYSRSRLIVFISFFAAWCLAFAL
ncbi:hypothetical protein MTR_1g094270 [Medicago truncatula]|uniref:Uncharacterized protein n=1 Tax=Medicago truncatula TaxID=3880 RepID=A0A072VQ18_MEDTR|nr:hypothetical protein MTR_1g094270 [Medicago truncatula]